ncbi:MAG: Trm112 family protein [Thiohalocapsa sp.]|nr:Trm112 family protein [Thiohalocapsa sp.]MCF7989148.1 Trm112 family protein [Thiohalocapsa sp.]
MLSPQLIEILACPICGGPLIYDPDKAELFSVGAGVAFPIRDDIPILLEEEARPMDEAELARLRGGRKRS